MAFADNFEQALKDFFFVNHPRQAKKIPQIVAEFKGQEVEAMLWLCKKYGVEPSTIEGLSGAAAAPAPVVEKEEAPVVEEAQEESTEESAAEEVEQEVEAKEDVTETTEEDAEDASGEEEAVEEKKED